MTTTIRSDVSGNFGALQVNGADAFRFGSDTSGQLISFRNKLLNSDMRLDQRNNGVAGSASGYTIDRWGFAASQPSKFFWQQGASSGPVGIPTYLAFAASSSYSPISTDYFTLFQSIEGNNVADLAWGSSSAKTVALSFWVRSSLTGQFSGAIRNSDYTRSYPFSFTINSAATWEYKTIIIPGCTDGTWPVNTSMGAQVIFNLGTGSNYVGPAGSWANANYLGVSGSVNVVATNGAYINFTGVQFERSAIVTPFENRPIGLEDTLCKRYFERLSGAASTPVYAGAGLATSATSAIIVVEGRVAKRITPSGILSGASTFAVVSAAGALVAITSIAVINTSANGVVLSIGTAGSLAAGNTTYLYAAAGQTGTVDLNSEL